MIHVILDNAKPHTAKRLTRYLEARHGRIVLHYLPKYSPEANPIERVWWKLHEQITRNHRCPDIASLLDQVMGWLGESGPFGVDDQVYFPDDKGRSAALPRSRGAIWRTPKGRRNPGPCSLRHLSFLIRHTVICRRQYRISLMYSLRFPMYIITCIIGYYDLDF